MTVSLVVISKDERSLDATLTAVEKLGAPLREVVVVDGSDGRLADIRVAHPEVRWIDYTRPAGVAVTIPHQRNAGVAASSGDIVAFTDSGCIPEAAWLSRLVEPIIAGVETVTSGPAHRSSIYGELETADYVEECATINMAFLRSVYDRVGGFDERFEYGSDIDFSWRIHDMGHRIRWIPDAVVTHDWGPSRRQAKRSYAYGIARARLYRKHVGRRREMLRRDPIVAVYPAFLLGLPIALAWPPYLLLLVVPFYRARAQHRPDLVVADHLLFGLGVLAEWSGLHRRGPQRSA